MSTKLKVLSSESGGQSALGYYKEPPLARVDPDSPESVAKWSEVLGLERKDLLHAVQHFGPIIRDIRRGLRTQKEGAA